MRGKQLVPDPDAVGTGITPADAGKTQPIYRFSLAALGITPADAGKTKLIIAHSNDAEDHPRGCGENIPNTKEKRHEIGSPPRMRGKLYSVGILLQQRGITPADAGKTFRKISIDLRFQDHPRGCGENTATACR